MGLQVGPRRSTTRTAIDDAAENRSDLQAATGSEVDGKYVEKISKLTPGIAEPFTITVPVERPGPRRQRRLPVRRLALRADGRAALATRCSASSGPSCPGSRRGRHQDEDSRYLWPLISTAAHDRRRQPNEQQTPDLPRRRPRQGDLARAAGSSRCWSAGQGPRRHLGHRPGPAGHGRRDDPQLPGPGPTATTTTPGTAPGGRQAVARRAAGGGRRPRRSSRCPSPTPTSPPSPTTAQTSPAPSAISRTATDVAASTVRTVLHVTPTTDFAWPVDGAVDPSIVKVATSAGADKVIARSDSLRRPAAWRTRPRQPARSAAAPRRWSPTPALHRVPGRHDEGRGTPRSPCSSSSPRAC